MRHRAPPLGGVAIQGCAMDCTASPDRFVAAFLAMTRTIFCEQAADKLDGHIQHFSDFGRQADLACTAWLHLSTSLCVFR